MHTDANMHICTVTHILFIALYLPTRLSLTLSLSPPPTFICLHCLTEAIILGNSERKLHFTALLIAERKCIVFVGLSFSISNIYIYIYIYI